MSDTWGSERALMFQESVSKDSSNNIIVCGGNAGVMFGKKLQCFQQNGSAFCARMGGGAKRAVRATATQRLRAQAVERAARVVAARDRAMTFCISSLHPDVKDCASVRFHLLRYLLPLWRCSPPEGVVDHTLCVLAIFDFVLIARIWRSQQTPCVPRRVQEQGGTAAIVKMPANPAIVVASPSNVGGDRGGGDRLICESGATESAVKKHSCIMPSRFLRSIARFPVHETQIQMRSSEISV